MVRALLDLNVSLHLLDVSSPAPDHAWWGQINFLVAIGHDYFNTQTPLILNGSPDTRVTGTSLAVLDTVAPVSETPATTQATYRLPGTLDSRGQRKSTPGVADPTCIVTAQAYATSVVFVDAAQWSLQYFGWLRVLWETP